MLIRVGRYIANTQTDDGRKLHTIRKAVGDSLGEYELTHNEYIVWKASTHAKTEEEWKHVLKKSGFEAVEGLIPSLLEKKLVVDVDLIHGDDKELVSLLVTPNGMPIQTGEHGMESGGLISDATYQIEHTLRLDDEGYAVYLAATGNNMIYVIMRVMTFLECTKEEAKAYIQKHMSILITTGLWTVEYVEFFPLFSPHPMPKASRRDTLIQTGFPLGVINEDGKRFYGIHNEKFLYTVQRDSHYLEWMDNHPKQVKDAQFKFLSFAPLSLDHIFLCPKGMFVRFDEESQTYLVKAHEKGFEVTLPAVAYVVWTTIHAYAPLSYVKERLMQMNLGFRDEKEVIEVFEEVCAFFTRNGLATAVVRELDKA